MKIDVIQSGPSQVFQELTLAVTMALIGLGHTVSSKADMKVWVGSYDNNHRLELNPDDFNIWYCTEQYKINPRYPNDFYTKKRKEFNAVFDIFRINVDKPSIYCPMGFSNIFERGYDSESPKMYGITHFGSLSVHERRKYLDNNLVTENVCFGSERDRLIQRSRMNLMISTYKNYELPPYRLLQILGLRGFAISEPMIDYGPYEPGKHFIIFDSLEDCRNEWINKPKERIEFGRSAYEDVKRNHPMEKYLEEAIRQL